MTNGFTFGFKIKAEGGPATAAEIRKIQQTVDEVKKRNEKAAATAKLLKDQYNLTEKEVADVTRELNKAEQASDKLKGSAGLLTNVFQGIGQGIGQQLTQALNQAIASVQRFVADGVAEFAEFEKALVGFDAKSDASADQIARIGEQAQELALITSQVPSGIAATGTALLTLGASADQVEQNLAGIVKLADVLGEDPVLTGKVIQTGLNNFEALGETSESLADKINTLINTTAAGSTGGAEEFFQFFQDVGPLAGTLNADFDELAAGFATLRDSGFTAATAATGMRIALLRLSAPTGEAAALLDDLAANVEGVDNLAFNADGSFRGFEATIQNFGAAIAGVNSDQERLEIAKLIFGDEGAPAVLAQLNQIDGKYANTLANLGSAAGSVDSSLEVINQSLSRQAELLQGSVQTLQGQLGAAFAPGIEAAVRFGLEVVNSLLEVEGLFDSLAEAGEDLGAALERNPEIAESLTVALEELLLATSDLVANGLNEFTDWLEDNPTAVADLLGTITELITLIGNLTEFVRPLVALLFEAGALFGVNAEGVAAFGGVLNQVNTTLASSDSLVGGLIQRLRNLIGIVDTVNGTNLSAGLGDGLESASDAANAANDAVQDFVGGVVAGAEAQAQAQADAAQSAQASAAVQVKSLESIAAASQDSANEISAAENGRLQEIQRLQNEGVLSEEEANDRRLASTQQRIQSELAAQQAYLAELESVSYSGEDEAKREAEIQKARQATAALELQLLESVGQAREEAAKRAEELAEEQAEAIQEAAEESLEAIADAAENFGDQIASAEGDRLIEIQRLQNEGVLSEEEANAARLASTQERIEAELQAEQTRIAELEALQLTGEAEEKRQDEIRASRERTQALTLELLETEADAFEQLEEEKLRKIDQRGQRQRQAGEAALQAIERESQALRAQQAIAQASYEGARLENDLAQLRVQRRIDEAEAAGDTAAEDRARVELADLQAQALLDEIEFKRQQLKLNQLQTSLDLERQRINAEIAIAEADIAVQKAIAAKASREEIENLQKVAQLERDKLANINEEARAQDQLNKLLEDALETEEDIAIEKARQIREDARRPSDSSGGSFPGRRHGGPVVAGQPYLVGEAGPELIVPQRRGYVLTAGQTAALAARLGAVGGALGMASPAPRALTLDSPGQPSNAQVVAELQQLRNLVANRSVNAPATYIINEPGDPYAKAAAISAARQRAIARGAGL